MPFLECAWTTIREPISAILSCPARNGYSARFVSVDSVIDMGANIRRSGRSSNRGGQSGWSLPVIKAANAGRRMHLDLFCGQTLLNSEHVRGCHRTSGRADGGTAGAHVDHAHRSTWDRHLAVRALGTSVIEGEHTQTVIDPGLGLGLGCPVGFAAAPRRPGRTIGSVSLGPTAGTFS